MGLNNMTRYTTDGTTRRAFTSEEEAAKDAEEKVWADGANDRAMTALREERNRRLAETDHHALSDTTLADNMKTYRQTLRDLPANTANPASPSWPSKP
jgi:hypothetical protein